MPESTATPNQVSLRIVWAPALISLCVSVLRLTGELMHWSPRWFSPETGGTNPQGVSWIIGITWPETPTVVQVIHC